MLSGKTNTIKCSGAALLTDQSETVQAPKPERFDRMLSQLMFEAYQQEAHNFQPGDVVYYLETITHPATGATSHRMKQGTIKAVDVASPYYGDTSRYVIVSGSGLSFLDYVEADQLELIAPAQAIDNSGLDRASFEGVL